MTDQLQPIIIYRYHDGALSPNPWKVVIFLLELSLPFEVRLLDRSDPDIRTKPPLVDITPNGRAPAMDDPNTDIKLWESGAIIEYLLDVYDKEGRLTYNESPQKYEQHSWKHFQMSGQGPYFGQLSWFLFLHPTPIPSAQARYAAEVRRVLAVLDAHLTRTNRPYLVGDALCFADLMFVPWNWQAAKLSMGKEFEEEWRRTWPRCWAWHERVSGRESCREAERRALVDWEIVKGALKVEGHSAKV